MSTNPQERNLIVGNKVVTKSPDRLVVHDLRSGDLSHHATPPLSTDGALTKEGIQYIARSAGAVIPASTETKASNNQGNSETVSKKPSVLSRVVGTIVDFFQSIHEARQAREEVRKAMSAERDAIDDAEWQSDGEYAVKHGAPRSRLDPNNRPSEIRKRDEFGKKFWREVVVVGTVVYCGYRLWKPGGDAGPVHPIDPAQPMSPPGTPTLVIPTPQTEGLLGRLGEFLFGEWGGGDSDTTENPASTPTTVPPSTSTTGVDGTGDEGNNETTQYEEDVKNCYKNGEVGPGGITIGHPYDLSGNETGYIKQYHPGLSPEYTDGNVFMYGQQGLVTMCNANVCPGSQLSAGSTDFIEGCHHRK